MRTTYFITRNSSVTLTAISLFGIFYGSAVQKFLPVCPGPLGFKNQQEDFRKGMPLRGSRFCLNMAELRLPRNSETLPSKRRWRQRGKVQKIGMPSRNNDQRGWNPSHKYFIIRRVHATAHAAKCNGKQCVVRGKRQERHTQEEAGGPPTAPLKERWPVAQAQYILNSGEREDEELCFVCFGALCTRRLWYVPILPLSRVCVEAPRSSFVAICERRGGFPDEKISRRQWQCENSTRTDGRFSSGTFTFAKISRSFPCSRRAVKVSWHSSRLSEGQKAARHKLPAACWHFAFECNRLRPRSRENRREASSARSGRKTKVLTLFSEKSGRIIDYVGGKRKTAQWSSGSKKRMNKRLPYVLHKKSNCTSNNFRTKRGRFRCGENQNKIRDYSGDENHKNAIIKEFAD